MPRDASGNVTLVPGNPVAPNTIIESDWANTTLQDVATMLQDSLSRSGLGGMQASFKNADGVISAPGISWVNEPASGWYRKSASEFWYSINGVDIFGITSAGIELASGLTAVNISSFINVQDDDPVTMKQGEQWFESDTGGLYMRYINPDLSITYIASAPAGGDFVPYDEKGAADGVAELDSSGLVPMAQLPAGIADGLAELDSNGTVPAAQIPQSTVVGAVLQVVAQTDVGSNTTSTSLTNMNASSVPITPKSTASKLLVEVTFYGAIAGVATVNNGGTFQLYDATAAALIGSSVVLSASAASGGLGVQGPLSLRAIVPNSVLTVRSFTLRGSCSNASGAVNATAMVWSITEIKT